MGLNENSVKKYFKSKKTVSTWWDPESISLKWFKALLLDQENILRKISPEGKIILDAGTGEGSICNQFCFGRSEEGNCTRLVRRDDKDSERKSGNFWHRK
jgi:hypothetical protein